MLQLENQILEVLRRGTPYTATQLSMSIEGASREEIKTVLEKLEEKDKVVGLRSIVNYEMRYMI